MDRRMLPRIAEAGFNLSPFLASNPNASQAKQPISDGINRFLLYGEFKVILSKIFPKFRKTAEVVGSAPLKEARCCIHDIIAFPEIIPLFP